MLVHRLTHAATLWVECLLLPSQWHTTPQARRQWERYRAMIAAAEAVAGSALQQPESVFSEPEAGCQPGAPVETNAQVLQPSGDSGAAVGGRVPKRQRTSAAASYPDGRLAHCSRAPSSAAGDAAGSKGSVQGAADECDRSVVHDTVGCIVVDAQGGFSRLLTILEANTRIISMQSSMVL